MDILNEDEIDQLIAQSKIASKYNQVVDSHSAYEILTDKLDQAAERTEEIKQQKEEAKETVPPKRKKKDSLMTLP